MFKKTTVIAFCLVLVGLVGYSTPSQASPELSTFLDELREGNDSGFIELLESYLGENSSNQPVNDPVQDSFRAFRNGDCRQSLAIVAATYPREANHAAAENKPLLLEIVIRCAQILFDIDLAKAAVIELISNSTELPRRDSNTGFWLGGLFAQHLYQGKSEEAEAIYRFYLKYSEKPEISDYSFFENVFEFGDLLKTQGKSYDQTVEFLTKALDLFGREYLPSEVLTSFHSMLLLMYLRNDQNDLAEETASELYEKHFDFIDARVADSLATYFIYAGDLNKAHDVLMQSFLDQDSIYTSYYWVNHGHMVKVLALLDKQAEATSWFESIFGSLEQSGWDDQSNKLIMPPQLSEVTKDTCVSWAGAVGSAGPVLESPFMTTWLSQNLMWHENWRSIFTSDCLIELLWNIHNGTMRSGRFEVATENAVAARTIYFRIGLDRLSKLFQWSHILASMFNELQDYKSSLQIADAARREFLRRKDFPNAFEMHLRSVLLLGMTDQDDKAEELELRGRNTYKKLAETSQYVASWLHGLKGLIEDDPTHEDHLVEMNSKQRFNILEGNNQVGHQVDRSVMVKAGRFLANGEIESAINEIKKLIEYRKRFGSPQHLSAFDYRLLYELLLANGQIDEAIEAIEIAYSIVTLPNNELISYRTDVPLSVWPHYQNIFLQYLRATTLPGGPSTSLNDGFIAAQRYKENALVRRIRQSAARSKVKNLPLIHELDELNNTIEKISSNSSLNVQAADQTLLEHLRKKDNLMSRIRDEHPNYFKTYFRDLPTISEVQSMLESNEALIVFVLGKHIEDSINIHSSSFGSFFTGYVEDEEALKLYRTNTLLNKDAFIWVIRNNSVALKTITVPYRDWGEALLDIEFLVDELRSSLDVDISQIRSVDDLPRFDVWAAKTLAHILFEPIKNELKGAERLIIVSDGVLHKLPFDALIVDDGDDSAFESGDYRGDHWLINKYAISVLPSVESFRMLRERAETSNYREPLAGFGDPYLESSVSTTTPNLPPIPETRTTLTNLADTLGSSDQHLFFGLDATEETVKNMDLTQFRTTAFATHGLLAGEIEGIDEPALVLTPPTQASKLDDGFLTASEVATLNITSELVLLSACNTGSGNDLQVRSGLPSLSSAFLYAGARSLVVSHWLAETTSTTMLVNKLMKNLAIDPTQGTAKALQKAKKGFIDAKAERWRSHPMFWAVYFSVGAN